mmetsp:Transcript_41318/g.122638  ORF Transcript_41318/g.122638 Transcript_41318/m.122638 type:complete len:236 (-) Transcript_41318:326-1033(-)
MQKRQRGSPKPKTRVPTALSTSHLRCSGELHSTSRSLFCRSVSSSTHSRPSTRRRTTTGWSTKHITMEEFTRRLARAERRSPEVSGSCSGDIGSSSIPSGSPGSGGSRAAPASDRSRTISARRFSLSSPASVRRLSFAARRLSICRRSRGMSRFTTSSRCTRTQSSLSARAAGIAQRPMRTRARYGWIPAAPQRHSKLPSACSGLRMSSGTETSGSRIGPARPVELSRMCRKFVA